MFEKIVSTIGALFISVSTLLGGTQEPLFKPLSYEVIEASPSPEVLAIEVEASPSPTPLPTKNPTSKPSANPTLTPTSVPLPKCEEYIKMEIDKELENLRAETKRRKELGLPLDGLEIDPRYQTKLKDAEKLRQDEKCI